MLINEDMKGLACSHVVYDEFVPMVHIFLWEIYQYAYSVINCFWLAIMTNGRKDHPIRRFKKNVYEN